MANNDRRTLLYVSHIKKYFDISSGFSTVGQVKAVDNVTFRLREGETLGIVGETGCGKTTLGRTILKLLEATSGDIYLNVPEEDMNAIIKLDGELEDLKESLIGEGAHSKDNPRIAELEGELSRFSKKYSLTKKRSRELKEYRKIMQPVYQDPFSSLDPRKIIRDILAEPMKLLTDFDNDKIHDVTKTLITEIGLSEDHLYRFPHEFSGGQRQRIGIARAISIEPKLLVLDEPTSALDVSVQAQILNKLLEIQETRGLSYIFISHHLNVVRMMSNRVAVMYLGKIVELTDTERLFTNMLHPYTKALLSAIPIPDPNFKREKVVVEGEIPNPADPPKGCHFHPRCRVAMRNCGWSPRDMVDPIKAMLDQYRNPEVRNLPPLLEIVVDEPSNELEVKFTAAVSDPSKKQILDDLIEKEAALPNKIMFKAIKTTTYPDSSTLKILMIEPDVPELKEAQEGHFVSCLIHNKNYWEMEKKVEDAKEPSPRAR